MQVKLLDPMDPHITLRRVWVAMRTCQSRKTPYELWQDSAKLTTEQMLPLVQSCYSSNHLSVFRHAEFMFGIGGISRSNSHQLVRHHVGFSPEQQSQRAVDPKYYEMVMPPSVEANETLKVEFEEMIDLIKDKVLVFNQAGIPKEDSRYLLPNATTTNLVVTANLNSLIAVSRERLCSLAQWEIRKLMAAMRAELGRAHPWTRGMLVISCMAQGYCSQMGNKDGHCRVRPYATAAQVTEALKA